MGVTDYGKSLRPRVYLENPLDKIQNLRELTVSPDYQSRGTFNPFYVLNVPVDDIKSVVGDGKIKYKSVDSGSGKLIKNYGGKYHFQINVDDEDTSHYIIAPKKLVTAHFGQKTRKDSTASSNVNVAPSPQSAHGV